MSVLSNFFLMQKNGEVHKTNKTTVLQDIEYRKKEIATLYQQVKCCDFLYAYAIFWLQICVLSCSFANFVSISSKV